MRQKRRTATWVGIILGAGALILGILQSGVAMAATPASKAQCSLATMHGTYMGAGAGVVVSGTTSTPFAYSYLETDDGKGGAKGIYTQSYNGTIGRMVSYSGTYTVNPDCTGTAVYTDTTGFTAHYDNFLAPDGSRTWSTGTDPGVVFSISAMRVSDGG